VWRVQDFDEKGRNATYGPGVASEIPYLPLPLDPSGVRYLPGPDSTVREGVPAGTVTELPWSDRQLWVYVPAQYDAAVPASLVVFQDGAGFLDPEDDLRTTVVLDNLIHRGDLPVTIAVFVDPGAERNAEYDPFDDGYATFLLDEVLPEVSRRWTVTDDHSRWGIGGFSSGGNCAFTVAWHRPDAFQRVICFLPSFAQMPGGNPYPALIPETPRKPLRVFIQAGHRDLGWDEPEDNWLANTLRVVAALAEGGYDVRLVLGDGGHDSNHAGALLPDALRWALG
jgi:enterochelin esterase family protein